MAPILSLPGPFLAGFECSSHRRFDGRRLDLIAATGHDRLVEADYRRVASHGIRGVRDALRWHLIERADGTYDWSSLLPMLEASRAARVTVLWDLCHYGYPDHLDIWTPRFVDRFARFSVQAVRLIAEVTGAAPLVCPMNEISFWAWAGGERGAINPCQTGVSPALKSQLVQAAITACHAIRGAVPETQIITAEPLISVVSYGDPERIAGAAAYHASQFEALEMMLGRAAPEMGGREDLIDIIGFNYYPHNQWYFQAGTIPLGHHEYRSLRSLLAEAHARFRHRLFIAETGAEGTARPAWLHYVASEVRAARRNGIPVEGICLYPILDYPGWDNDRRCEVGLYCGTDERVLDDDYAAELARQQALFAAMP